MDHAAAWLALVLLGTGCAAPGPSIDWSPPGEVAVSLHEETLAVLAGANLGKTLAVFVPGATADPPPIVGRHELGPGRLVFRPRFEFEPGVRYRVVFDGRRLPEGAASADRKTIERTFRIRPQSAPRVGVTRIYPSSDELPANLLRFYVHFSGPMSQGEAYAHLALRDAEGRQIELPFLELGEELWDPDGRRFTLLFDPGRVKRGLLPRETVGPVLEAGRSYTLHVAASWLDAHGQRLLAPGRKSFRVVAADRTQPDPRRWTLTLPPAGSRTPLVVDFQEPIDHALLQHMVWVRNGAGREIDGDVRVTRGERRWAFRPLRPWQAGRYQLVADARLEDPSGNSIASPFEVDALAQPPTRLSTRTVSLPFSLAR